MTDEDDRFGDVAEQLKQTGEEPDEGDESTAEDSPQSPAESPTENGGDEPDSATDRSEDHSEKSTGKPAFSFDETDMHGFYVRQETWDAVSRTQSSVAAACSMFDVSEFEGREFQDACLRVVADHADEIALQILRERGVEADEERIREVVEMLNEQAEDD